MRILVLGGTIFLGRHIVECALDRDHAVTLFNRGRHNPELFPDVEKVRGDRDGGLSGLGDREFDAVIDTCGYVPRVVRQSAAWLAARCSHYTFISSLSVYADNSVVGQDETAPVGRIDDPTVEEITGESYGALKRLCEEEVERALPGRALLVRPGLIVGPHDPSDRFTYWPWRMTRGGDALVPEPRDARVEFTDVRDVARWTVASVEHGRVGVFNVTGPTEDKLGFARFLELCGAGPTLEWASREWLAVNHVALWTDLPLCTDLASPGISTRSTHKAVAAGMRFRPPSETVRDTLEWARCERTGPLKAGLTPERESALVAALRSGR